LFIEIVFTTDTIYLDMVESKPGEESSRESSESITQGHVNSTESPLHTIQSWARSVRHRIAAKVNQEAFDYNIEAIALIPSVLLWISSPARTLPTNAKSKKIKFQSSLNALLLQLRPVLPHQLAKHFKIQQKIQ
jgi:hypothetical protein